MASRERGGRRGDSPPLGHPTVRRRAAGDSACEANVLQRLATASGGAGAVSDGGGRAPLLPGAGGVLVEFGGTATRATRQGRGRPGGSGPARCHRSDTGYVPPSAPLSACPYPQQEVKGRRGVVAPRRFSLAVAQSLQGGYHEQKPCSLS